MIGATSAHEWVVTEVILPLMTNRPGEPPFYMPTLVASEWPLAIAAGKEGTIKGFSRCSHPGIRSDDSYGSWVTNTGLDSAWINLDPQSDSLSGAVESNRIPRLCRGRHRTTGTGTSVARRALSALLFYRRARPKVSLRGSDGG